MENLDFGTKLIEVRKAKGLTQEEIAEKCKITVRTIQRIESGLVKPRAFTIKIISDVLGLDFFETSNTGYDVKIVNQNPNLGRHTILWYLKDLFNLKTNTMKKISILTTSFLMIGFALLVFTTKTNAQSDKGFNSITIQLNEDKSINRIEVAFSNRLTFDSLVHIKNDLKAKGLTINYKKIEFNKNNLLTVIDSEVDCNDGYIGSFAMSFLDSQNKDKKIGFYRDYSKNSKNPFGTGGLKN